MKNKAMWGVVFLFVLVISAVFIPVLNAGVISIPPCGARADDQEGFTWYADMTEFYVDSYNLNPSPDIYIPVNLPNGVSIKKFTAILSDNTVDPKYPLEVSLVRVNLINGNFDYLAGVDSWTGHAINRVALTTTKISNKIIDNNHYAYALYITEWYPTSDRKFHGAKIFY